MNKIYIAYIFIIIAIFCIALVPKNLDTKIIKVADLNALRPPLKLRRFILKTQNPLLTVIHYDGKTLRCLDGIKHDLTSNIYLNALAEVAKTGHVLKPGWYVLSFSDGVHAEMGCPVLAFAATIDLVQKRRVVLMPDPEAMNGYEQLFAKIDAKSDQYTWEKKIPKVFWRGSPTGNGGRVQFVNYAGSLDIANVAFADKYVAPEDATAYRYLFDIDGNSCSYSRMAWILYSNSVLMKQSSNKVQWYYDLLQPYHNFIPIAADFSDLQQRYDWAQTHALEVQAIAQNGRKLAREVFSRKSTLLALENAFNHYHLLFNTWLNDSDNRVEGE